jgi:hypothetical protein
LGRYSDWVTDDYEELTKNNSIAYLLAHSCGPPKIGI